MRFAHLSLPLLSAAVFLTGCGFTADTIAPVNPASKGIHGRIMGGQQPVVGATVGVYALGYAGNDATLLGSTTTTDQNGNFTYGSYTCPAGPLTPSVGQGTKTIHPATSSAPKITSRGKLTISGTKPSAMAHARPAVLPDLTETYVYITATGGDSGGGLNSSILLAAGLGKCSDAQTETVEINEVSTVVFAAAMANYSNGGGSDFFAYGASPEAITAMDIADTNTVQNFVNLSTGLVNPNVVSTAPGGTSITIEAAKIYSLANTIASCVNSADDVSDPDNPAPSTACQNLYAALPYGGVTNTMDAASAIAYVPYTNVAALWALGSATGPFPGGLATAPNDWTLGISYTTNAMGLGLFPEADGSPTSSNIDIDSSGRVWFPSNKSGATGVGYFDPTEAAFNGPFGGAYLVQPQYVALDDNFQDAFATDLQSNNVVGVDTTPGGTNGVGYFTIPSDGLGSGPNSTGPLFVNYDDSLDLAYRDTGGGYDMILVNPDLTGEFVGTFIQAPTGLTTNGTLGLDPDDSQDPIGVAATNGPSTVCSLEVTGDIATQGSLPGPISTTTNPCVSGGAATVGIYQTGDNSIVQDELTTAVTANEICSQLGGSCFAPMVTPAGGSSATVNLANGPNGVAVDGNEEVWLANSGNASIAVFDAVVGTPDFSQFSDRPYLHGTDNGGTMIAPTGVAVDAAGNIWVSNATCTSMTDTTCSFTLSEVIGAAYPTVTPLANQAGGNQGYEPETTGKPGALSRKRAANMAGNAKGAFGKR